MNRKLRGIDAVFLHVPRTGGTWVLSALYTCRLRSTPWGVVEDRPTMPRAHRLPFFCVQETVPAALITFVRHPVAYYESVWKWIAFHDHAPTKARWTWHPFRRAIETYEKDGTFERWVRRIVEEESCWYTRMLEDYVGPAGAEYCDYIGRTKTLQRDFVAAVKDVGIELDPARLAALDRLPLVNAVPAESFGDRLRWTDELRELVLRNERVTVSRFFGPDTSDLRYYGRWIGRR